MDLIADFMALHFWVALGQIVVVDILLGGDNAVVIALACRRLPREQRTRAILYGTAGAIALRVVLIVFALALLQVPFLRLTGALLLLWIGIKLIAPPDEGEHGRIKPADRLWAAVRTVIVADLVMSLDNVIAIAAVAKNAGEQHELVLVVLGLLISVPIIVWGSQLALRLMDRFPFIVILGGMLLGWIAGAMAQTDPVAQAWIGQDAYWHYGMGAAGALLVLALGTLLAKKRPQAGSVK